MAVAELKYRLTMDSNKAGKKGKRCNPDLLLFLLHLQWQFCYILSYFNLTHLPETFFPYRHVTTTKFGVFRFY